MAIGSGSVNSEYAEKCRRSPTVIINEVAVGIRKYLR